MERAIRFPLLSHRIAHTARLTSANDIASSIPGMEFVISDSISVGLKPSKTLRRKEEKVEEDEERGLN